MTFSLRLTADLTLALAARAFGPSSSPILLVSSEETFGSVSARDSHKAGSDEDSLAACIARVSESRSRLVWIAGSEPLDHPEAARFANAVASGGRHVFLETSGASLKRRLHEFKPSSRFHFVVRFEGLPANDGAVPVGLEALRMARLAGFFTFAQLLVRRNSIGPELEKLLGEIRTLDVDGFLITPSTKLPELQKVAADLRRRLGISRGALLSRLLDSAIRTKEASRSPRAAQHLSLPEQQPQEDSFAESAELP